MDLGFAQRPLATPPPFLSDMAPPRLGACGNAEPLLRYDIRLRELGLRRGAAKAEQLSAGVGTTAKVSLSAAQLSKQSCQCGASQEDVRTDQVRKVEEIDEISDVRGNGGDREGVGGGGGADREERAEGDLELLLLVERLRLLRSQREYAALKCEQFTKMVEVWHAKQTKREKRNSAQRSPRSPEPVPISPHGQHDGNQSDVERRLQRKRPSRYVRNFRRSLDNIPLTW